MKSFWFITVVFLTISSAFQTIFFLQLLEKTINSIGHCIYLIYMVQEILLLIIVLQFHSDYHRLIWSHSTEWNVVIYRHL